MVIRVTSTVVEIVVQDPVQSVRFYRLLGLPVSDEPGPHVEVQLPGGNRLAFDTEETPAAMHPEVAIAFGVDSPDQVDALYERLTAGRPSRHADALRRTVTRLHTEADVSAESSTPDRCTRWPPPPVAA